MKKLKLNIQLLDENLKVINVSCNSETNNHYP